MLNAHSAHRIRFVIAGQGKTGLQERLLRLRSQLGLEEVVEFLGFEEDPAAFLANLDIFLLTSTSEGFSIATIQAMASGLPVVVTQSGGPQEIVTHDENGWMVEAGSPDAIADALDLLAGDPELIARLAAQGQQHAIATFSLGAMLGAYQALYQPSG